MSDRNCTVWLALWLLAPGAALAQHAEADDTEVIQPPRVKPAADEKKPALAAVAKQVIDKTNAFRKKEGRSPVTVNASLGKAAAGFAAYMARTDRYGHTADGQRPADRAKKAGYEYCIVLENIAYQYHSRGFTTAALAEGFFEGWQTSPGHRRNMLDADVTETGAAVARSDTTGYYYAVQLFGRPKSKAITYSIANRSAVAVRYHIGEQSFTLQPNYTRTHTRCRPGDVEFRTADGKETKRKVSPANQDRFVLTTGRGGYQVKKE